LAEGDAGQKSLHIKIHDDTQEWNTAPALKAMPNRISFDTFESKNKKAQFGDKRFRQPRGLCNDVRDCRLRMNKNMRVYTRFESTTRVQ
ncbi:MAG: hypothetical protein K9I85_05470, partial [Saprospiraceae bacterium]|nr:hypothetical protein [Saprospiraceae bacterium]